MRHALGLALIAFGITSSGCALVQDSCQNVLVGIKTPLEEHREKARNRQWAETAWQQVLCTSRTFPNFNGPSEDYARGFKEGFAEYLFRGGDGEPPLVAPVRYRDARYQNENGYHAVQDWFAGYRHGTAMAHESGARKWITGPSSLQGEVDGHHIHGEPPLPAPPTPEKLTPIPIPLPQPKVLPKPSDVQRLITPLPAPREWLLPRGAETGLPPAPLEPMPSGAAETAPLKAQTEEPADPQAPSSQPDAEPSPPLPEPVRLQIRRITESSQSAPGPAIITGPTTEAKGPAIINGPTTEARGPAIINGPTTDAKGLAIINGTPDEGKIRITGIHDAPPLRARITEITPQKD